MTARTGLLGALSRLFGAERAPTASVDGVSVRRTTGGDAAPAGGAATVEIRPPRADALTITYAPARDGDPDAGEVVWTWVPYAENDGRGKDRPVLVVARQDAERVFAVRLTSKSHDGDRDFLSIGSGAWDSQGRPSWVDIDQVYSVHVDGMRREASALDLERFVRVADALHRRYGWSVGS
jgi:PemK-like, MazF-like toxin of type II toxin-antitoxin system